MADSSLKIGLELDTKKFEQQTKEIVVKTKQELTKINGEKILTPDSIKKAVEKRTTEYKSNLRNGEGKGLNDNELNRAIDILKEKGTIKTFKNDITGQVKETPWELEKNLKIKYEEQQAELKKLGIVQDIQKVEEDISKENQKQLELNEDINDEKEKNVDVSKKGKAEVSEENKGQKSDVTIGNLMGALISADVIASFIMKAIEVIIALVTELFMFAIGESTDLQDTISVIKAMIESIAYTLAPYIQKIVEWILNAIIESLRFVQHAVYALTGVDILKFTGDRLAENMKKTAKSAEDTRKQLMGFDEANILSDTSSEESKNNPIEKFNGMDLTIDEDYFDKLYVKIVGFVEGVDEQLQKPKEFFSDTLTTVREKIESGNVADLFNGLIDPDTFKHTLEGLGPVVEGFLMTLDGQFKMFISGPWKIITGLIEGDWDKVWEGCGEIISGFVEWTWGQLLMIGGFVMTVAGLIIDGIVALCKFIYQWIYDNVTYPLAVKIIELRDKIVEKVTEIKNNVVNKVTEIWNGIYNTFIQPLIDAYNQYLKPIFDKVGEFLNMKNESFNWDFNLTGDNGILSGAWNGIKSGWNKLWGHDSGGIVLAQPGHGVPVTDVMSERRSEAIIPFENPTAMEKIGEAIGRYVNIAIDNKMVVDGKTLATATNNAVNKERFLMNR